MAQSIHTTHVLTDVHADTYKLMPTHAGCVVHVCMYVCMFIFYGGPDLGLERLRFGIQELHTRAWK